MPRPTGNERPSRDRQNTATLESLAWSGTELVSRHWEQEPSGEEKVSRGEQLEEVCTSFLSTVMLELLNDKKACADTLFAVSVSYDQLSVAVRVRALPKAWRQAFESDRSWMRRHAVSLLPYRAAPLIRRVGDFFLLQLARWLPVQMQAHVNEQLFTDQLACAAIAAEQALAESFLRNIQVFDPQIRLLGMRVARVPAA